jgi:hypothetical protein
MLAAETVGTTRSYSDRYPSACAGLAHLAEWPAGDVARMTDKLFTEAQRRLEVARLPST